MGVSQRGCLEQEGQSVCEHNPKGLDKAEFDADVPSEHFLLKAHLDEHSPGLSLV